MADLRAVVTGASSGIGAATVRRLVADGWHVTAVARRAGRLADLARETGCDVFAADVTSDGEVAALADHVGARGGVNLLVNNAGGALGMDPIADVAARDLVVSVRGECGGHRARDAGAAAAARGVRARRRGGRDVHRRARGV